MSIRKKVVVAGASGLVGNAAVRHFAAEEGCDVVAVSRRPPLGVEGVSHVAVDLTDAEACTEVFGAMDDVTHLVYAAVYERADLVSGWLEQEQIRTNARMLRNLFEPLDKAARQLRHVTLLQGTKAYGAHIRPIQIPARENRSEVRGQPNFYWEQETYIRERQAGRDWGWTILRPQIVFGLSLGSAMNLIPAIGAYAAILREQGRSLAYPGGPANVLEACDADLLARVVAWAGEANAAANEVFNVTNGDVFVWREIWPVLAEMLGMVAGPDEPAALGETMPAYAETWERIRKQYSLKAPPLTEFVGESFQYADFCMAYGAGSQVPPPAIVSTVKLRQAGFHEVMDTEAMFEKHFRRFEAEGLLPPP